MTNAWLRVSAVSGASAVALGAIGAHALMKRSDSMKEIWKTANFYHFVHTLSLTTVAFNVHGPKRNLIGSLFLGGIVLFSGSLYTIVILDQKKPFQMLAPIGGFCFIGGWLALALL